MTDLEARLEEAMYLAYPHGPLYDWDHFKERTRVWVETLTLEDALKIVAWIKDPVPPPHGMFPNPREARTGVADILGEAARRLQSSTLREAMEQLLEDPETREYILYGFVTYHPPESIPKLLPYTQDDDENTIALLISSFVRMDAPEVRKILLDMYSYWRRRNEDIRQRIEAYLTTSELESVQ